MQSEKKVFRSRISVLPHGVLLTIIISIFVSSIIHQSHGIVYIMDGILVLLIFSSTGFRYSITGNKLYLKVWFISMGSANIDDITSVERTYDLTSAPASALKRLCICFKNGVKYLNWLTWQCAPNWLISPVREKEFIEALRAINPDICVSIPETKEKWRIWDWDI